MNHQIRRDDQGSAEGRKEKEGLTSQGTSGKFNVTTQWGRGLARPQVLGLKGALKLGEELNPLEVSRKG